MSRFANYNISLYNMINCVEMLPVDIFRKQKLSNTQSENILNQSLSLFSEKIPWNHQSITSRAPKFHPRPSRPRYMPDICHGQVSYGYNWCIYIYYQYMPDICQIYAMVHIVIHPIMIVNMMGFQIPMDPLMTVAHCGTSMTILTPMILVLIVTVIMGWLITQYGQMTDEYK